MKITEQESLYKNLESQSTSDLLHQINQEDIKVAKAVNLCINEIESLIESILPKIKNGGRLFYIGAGSSGRIGILDASECPPTFGVSNNIVIGLIAGGDKAIRRAVEFAEDDFHQGWKDLNRYSIGSDDTVIGIAASGTTPYVVGALEYCQSNSILTASISCNSNAEISKFADYPIEVIVGPEFITGSTRMKSGTAQKMILNMISTSLMIKLGKVKNNKMIDMQLSNEKLVERGTKMVAIETKLDDVKAKKYLLKYKSVRKAIIAFKNGK